MAEGEDLRLLSHVVPYRMVYTLMLDLCKMCATVEELRAVDMDWGNLERAGRL